MTTRPGRTGSSSEALAAVRHDLNNMLMSLLGQLELLRDVGPLSTEVRERLNAISRQIDRIRERVSDLAEIESNESHQRRSG